MRRPILALVLCLPLWADSHYVDCNKANDSGDGLTPETAKKNLNALNSDATVIAGDVIRLKRGCSWSSGSIVRAANITYTLYDVADTGALPIVSDSSAAFTLGAGDTGIVIDHLDMRRTVTLTGGASVTIYDSIIQNSGANGLTVTGSTATLYNTTIIRNAAYGIQTLDTGGSPTVTARNVVIAGNGYGTGDGNGGYGVSVSAGGTFDYDYSILVGNGRPQATPAASNITGTGTKTDGGHNLVSVFPWFRSTFVASAPYFWLSIDGDDHANVDTYVTGVADALDAQFGAGAIPLTVFLTNIAQLPAGDYATLAGFPARGLELGIHGWTHSDITKTTAFQVSTTNGGTNTITVDRAASTLALTSTGNPANNVTVDWSLTDQRIADLKTAVAGKGWTITNTTGISDWVRLKALDNQTSTAFPYTANMLMSAFYAEEFDDVIGWMQTNLGGYTPNVIAYGGGYNNAAAHAYVGNNAAFLCARSAGSGSLWMPSLKLPMLAANNFSLHLTGLTTEADVRAVARHLYVLALMTGGYMGLFWHSTDAATVTNQKLLWFVDEIRDIGGAFTTGAAFAAVVRAGHTTSDNITWTKTYTDLSDYRLKPYSPAVRTGTDLGDTYKTCWSPKTAGDTLDRDVYGWSIGPYCWVRGPVGVD